MRSELVTVDELVRPHLWIADGFVVQLPIGDEVRAFKVVKSLFPRMGFGVKKNIVIGAYIIRNTVTGLAYVGSSKNVGARFNQHRSTLGRGIHENLCFQTSYNAGLPDDFEAVVIRCATREDAFDVEQFFIDYFIERQMCHNTANDARNNLSFAKSEETIQRLRERMKNRVVSDETRKRLSVALQGRTFEDKTRLKMSLKAKESLKSGNRLQRLREFNDVKKKRVTIDGVVYESVLDASRKLSVPESVVGYRLKSTSPRFVNWKYTES